MSLHFSPLICVTTFDCLDQNSIELVVFIEAAPVLCWQSWQETRVPPRDSFVLEAAILLMDRHIGLTH